VVTVWRMGVAGTSSCEVARSSQSIVAMPTIHFQGPTTGRAMYLTIHPRSFPSIAVCLENDPDAGPPDDDDIAECRRLNEALRDEGIDDDIGAAARFLRSRLGVAL
jgi:hypothetical protein